MSALVVVAGQTGNAAPSSSKSETTRLNANRAPHFERQNTMKLLFPDASQRSPTAVAGKSDLRDENVYSSGVVTHGGSGTIQLFTVPRGGVIPILTGFALSASPNAHQAKYTELTTNITQAGQFGSALGEGSVRGVGLDIENGYANGTTGMLNTYGAGMQEVTEVLAKMFFRLSIGGKKQIESAVRHLPAAGGGYGSVATGTTATIASQLSNGIPGSWRNLKVPILIARTDTVVGDLGVAGGSSLVFQDANSPGQPCLIWAVLKTAIKGDAR